MSLQLPGELTEPLGWIGLAWQQADEDKLYSDGQIWISYGTTLRGQAEQAATVARRVWTDNTGESIDAFEAWWTADGPGRTHVSPPLGTGTSVILNAVGDNRASVAGRFQ